MKFFKMLQFLRPSLKIVFRGKRMKNEELRMKNEEWRMKDGKWRMVN